MTACRTAICVPGRKLLPDGSAPPILLKRVEEAAAMWREAKGQFGPPLLILSGGKVPVDSDEAQRAAVSEADLSLEARQRVWSEAECMGHIAMQNGVPQECIVLEQEALHTIENAINIRDLARMHGLNVISVITSQFHMGRTSKIFTAIFEADEGTQLSFHPMDDAALMTVAEREREDIVEPAMTERLPAHLKAYKRFLKGDISLAQARKIFFQADHPHSHVYTLPIIDDGDGNGDV